MTDGAAIPSGAISADASAGELLKAARTANGIHIAALAAAIKVSVRKLELLEADRFDELPDATFARALAQTVCRFLKVDPAPILAKLPHGATVSQLEHVARGLNQPFRDPGTRRDGPGLAWFGRPAVWLPVLLVVASVGLWLAPPGVIKMPAWWGQGDTGAGMAPQVAQDLPPPIAAASETVHSAPSTQEASAPTTTAMAPAPASAPVAPTTGVATAAAPAGSVVLQARAASWVEVQEAGGRVLISRVLAAGEAVGLEGSFPMRVKVGNASETQVLLRGQVVDLTPYVRDNVARVELK